MPCSMYCRTAELNDMKYRQVVETRQTVVTFCSLFVVIPFEVYYSMFILKVNT